MGNACINLGRYHLATKNYLQGLSVYNYKYQTGNILLKWNLKLETFLRQKFIKRFMLTSSKKISKDSLKVAEFLHLLSVSLLMEGKQISSLKTCQISLNLGFTNTNPWNFYEKCQLFLSVAKNLEQLKNYQLLEILIENIFLMIRQKENWCNVEELIVLANIFFAIIKIEFRRGNFAKTVAIGTKLLRLTNILHLYQIKLIALPLIIESMMRLKRFNETVDLMHELFYLSPADSDKSSLTWYYALSVDLVLDAGITLESYQNCLTFAEKIIDKIFPIVRDPEGKKRLIVSIRTWQLRNGITVNAFLSQSVKTYINLLEIDELSQIITTCRILECLLLTLTSYINLGKYLEADKLTEKIAKILKLLENETETNIFITPRLHLLKAYLCLIKNKKLSTTLNLCKAKKLAKKYGNHMDLAWIIQNEKMWKIVNYKNITPYWIEYIANNDGINWKYVESLNIYEWSTILYPMPIPNSII
ncbi:uncharacterized protein LOC127277470 [Leptopilina boulardi]|uniref:uncharacterized protein LOC127277470 n=1 Tax=Leptopilina boulardi TaxID=63433 RepID=UPI0021F5E55A|nr:uncharacterized protein LOC127277470 [Leptopilina boulardi]